MRVAAVVTHEHAYSEPSREYAARVLALAPDLCGYGLVEGKSGCDHKRVKRYTPTGHCMASGQQGLFAGPRGLALPALA